MRTIPVHVVEYGKYFLPDGSSDYSVLAYTEGAKFNLKAYGEYLKIRDNPEFDNTIGNTSAVFISIDQEKFLFVQLHRRSEGELSPDKSPTNRPFTQIRYTQLNEYDFLQLQRIGFSPLLGLAYQSPFAAPSQKFHLKTFHADGILIADSEKINPLLLPWETSTNGLTYPEPLLYKYQIGELDSSLYSLIKRAVDGVIEYRSVIIVDNGKLEFLDKLLLAQAIQALVYPKKGLISFAFDPITKREVNLQFSKVPLSYQGRDTKILEFEKMPTPDDQNIEKYSYWILKFFTSAITLGENKKVKQRAWVLANERLYNEVFVNNLRLGVSPEDSFAILALDTIKDVEEFLLLTGHSRREIFDRLVKTYFVFDKHISLPMSGVKVLLQEAIQSKYPLSKNSLLSLSQFYSKQDDFVEIFETLKKVTIVDITTPNSNVGQQQTPQKNATKDLRVENMLQRIKRIKPENTDDFLVDVQIAIGIIEEHTHESVKPLLRVLQSLFKNMAMELQKAQWQIGLLQKAQSKEILPKSTKPNQKFFKNLPRISIFILEYLVLLVIIWFLIRYLLF